MPKYLIARPGTDSHSEGIDWNRDGTVTLGERILSATVAGAAIWILLQLTWYLFCIILRQPFPTPAYLRTWLPATTLLVAAGAALLLVWRMIDIERTQRELSTDTKRRRRFEDEERQWIDRTEHAQPTPKITQARLDAAVLRILRAYYANGTFARGTVPGLTDPVWNKANELLKAAGIRRGRSTALTPETLPDAWARYLDWSTKRTQWTMDTDGDLRVKP